MAELVVDNISMRFDLPDGSFVQALQNVSLSLESGELLSVLGPSGCGKTTLLNIVAGLDDDFEGAVEVAHAGGDEARIGYVFQAPRLLPWLSVERNLALVVADGDPAPAVDRVIAATGLTAHRGHFPGQLSGGLARRVALARALVIEPDLLLLDEPFVSLDQAGGDDLRREVRAVLDRRPVASLFVTHDLREAALMADRIVFLSAAPGTVAGEVSLDAPYSDRFDPAWLEPVLAELSRSVTA